MEPEQIKETSAQPHKKLKLFVIVGAVFLLLAIGIFYVVVIRGGGNVSEGLRSILPFGNEAGDGVINPNTGGGGKLGDVGIGNTENGERPRMWKIAEGPVAGSVFKTLPDGTLSVRYALREDGDIYEYSMPARSGRILANNTVPRVAEAVWDARAQSVVLRTATEDGNIISVLGRLLPNPAVSSGDETPAILQQSFLPENIDFLSAGWGEGFIHTLRVGNELSVLTLDGAGASTPVFTSPFSEWVPDWSGKNIYLYTRPSGLVGGYAFLLDPKTAVATPIINDFTGLTIKSAPDGEYLLIGGAKNNRMTFGIITKDFPIPSDITPATLPEKCAWTASSTFAFCGVPQSPASGIYPDVWYQGLVQFSDTIWMYDRVSGQFTLFVIPQTEVSADVDVTSPLVSESGDYLIFTNKKDGSLWGLVIH